jgi:hypothetical protein
VKYLHNGGRNSSAILTILCGLCTGMAAHALVQDRFPHVASVTFN